MARDPKTNDSAKRTGPVQTLSQYRVSQAFIEVAADAICLLSKEAGQLLPLRPALLTALTALQAASDPEITTLHECYDRDVYAGEKRIFLGFTKDERALLKACQERLAGQLGIRVQAIDAVAMALLAIAEPGNVERTTVSSEI